MAISFITGLRVSIGTSSSIPCSIPSYTPEADDIIYLDCRVTASDPGITVPSDWVNVLGGDTFVGVTSLSGFGIYHKVTSAEAASPPSTWGPSGIYSSSKSTNVIATVLRGVDPTNPLDVAGSASSDTTTASHQIPSLTPGFSNSLVVGGVRGGSTQTYTTPVTGWTLIDKNVGGQQALAGFYRTALTTAGVATGAATVTASSATRFVGLAAAFRELGAGGAADDSGSFFAFF